MRVESLRWDDANIEHIANHSVSPDEVEDVCFGLHLVRKERPLVYIMSGQTSAGRYINVVVEHVGKGQFRPITAFEMSENYKKSYRARMKKKAIKVRR